MEYSLELFKEKTRILYQDIVNYQKGRKTFKVIYPIPQGGVPLAMELSNLLNIPISNTIPAISKEEILIVDDLIDSGKTIYEYLDFPIAVLGIKHNSQISKQSVTPIFYGGPLPDEWIHFWWEPKQETDPEKHITRLLEYIGENPNRDGLIDTPKRIVKSWERLFGGYKQNPEDIIKTFKEEKYDEMVLLKDIALHSTCEHHMLPFTGVAHIAYIPNGRVLGISKLARLLEIYARRMQIQERICDQVTEALMKYLKPVGAACIIEARHSCMTARGVEQQSSTMITSSLKGAFLEKLSARNELMKLIR